MQTINHGALVDLARERDLVLRVLARAGHFVLGQGEHVVAHADAMRAADGLEGALRSAIVVGSQRSPAQDLEFSIRRLVEIALRALSPSINDPFTAISAVDRLGEAVALLADRDLPRAVSRDTECRVRVIASRSDADGLVAACFAQLRQAGRQHPAVLIHMSDTVGKLLMVLDNVALRQALLRHLGLLQGDAWSINLSPGDFLRCWLAPSRLRVL